jgi:hypothetical protein
MKEQALLASGMVVIRAGLYRVDHQCVKERGEAYMWIGAILPRCPNCDVKYVLIRESETPAATQAAAS